MRPSTEELSPAIAISLSVAVGAILFLAIGVLAAVSDKRSRRELRKRKIQLDVALENMAQGLCMFDKDGRITLFNQQYAQIMGLSPTFLKGSSLLEVLKCRHSSGALSLDPELLFETIKSNARSGTATDIVVESSPGQVLRIGTRPTQGGGWVATYNDITEQHQSETLKNIAFRSIDACPVAIAISDPTRPDSPLIYANRMYAQMIEYGI